MRVWGDLSTVQFSIDFYLNISSTGKIKTIEELRKQFFLKFLREERAQMQEVLNERLAEIHKEDEDLEEVNLSEEINENEELEEIEETEESSTQRGMQFFQNLAKVTSNESTVEDNLIEEDLTENGLIEDEDFSTQQGMSFFQNLGKFMQVQESEEVEEVEEVLEETEQSQGMDFFKNLQKLQSSIEEEYASHGIYVDTMSLEGLPEIKQYTTHGIFLDEIILEDVQEYEEVEDAEEYEEEIEDEEIEEITEYATNGIYLEDIILEDRKPKAESTFTEEISEMDDIIKEDDSDVGDFGISIEEEEIEEKVITQNLKPDEVVKKDIEVPNDIRSFLKKYPNSDYDLVLKYFSKKEIEKQIKLGRVFKKKGKLVI